MIQKIKCSVSSVSALMLCGALSSSPQSVDLQEAIVQNLILFTAEASHKEDRVDLAISLKNLTSKNIEIHSAPGLQLEPVASEYQNMLLIDPLIVMLQSQEEKDLLLTAYCTEIEDSFPMEQLVYSLANHPKEDLTSLGSYIYNRPDLRLHEEVIQSAVWTVSDGSELSAIYEADSPSVFDLRAYCIELTGLEDTWYNMDTDYSVDSQGMLISEPKEISGKLTINSEVVMSVRSFMVNEAGDEVWTSSNSLEVPKGEVDISFQLRVENWPKGTYTIYYKSKTETLLAQEFTL